MRKHLHNTIKILLIILIGIFVYFLGILIINMVYDYKPVGAELGVTDFRNYDDVEWNASYSMITWNIGYAGLGNNADFFYDGGKMARPYLGDFNRYWDEILEQLHLFDSVSFLLLQEVDIASRRSYKINQFDAISTNLSSHGGFFVKNYDVMFVPVPLFNPMGKVVSGISFFTKKRIIESCWREFDGDRSWPMGLFLPDRCFMQVTFDLEPGKKLYIINTHNSAFDDGSERDSQLGLLYYYMLDAYQDGNYVIAGGDWNINPAGFANEPFISGDVPFDISGIQQVKGPDENWKIVFDPYYPTNRDVSAPYVPGLTPTTIIDFFVCSPNIRVLDVKTLYDGFRNTDHHPVYFRFGFN